MNKNIIGNSNCKEKNMREEFVEYFNNSPIPDDEILNNLGLFISRQNLSRILFMNELYKKIINVHGVVIEFGVRYGQNLALFESFRGMYEPFNYNRKIIGFDTFEGFKCVDKKDGKDEIIKENSFNVPKNYEDYLEKVLDYHEGESPISHIKKYELVKGDAIKTIHEYLEKNPQTIIAFAYFDFDIYKPTKECLIAIKNHLTKGSVIGFDELNYERFPGETLAFKEVFGLDNYAIKRSPLNPLQSYIVIE
ncbi:MULTISPECIES: crotonobetainyl-CoA--carnitine CoA-transferase [Clostridium]|uniref:Putative dTDP-6-deoxy-L-hexose 3-O-methyltransferase n=1 Tax=Clostridium sporogenes TaxID=1509 RepID=A0A1L3NFV8_CLOSG|nr:MULTISPECIES: crotonobetainyl-CoA--carnitine CoA-transferase [Clostridium]APH14992.1 putative dTDP-6-deoxy-L-hexose 3-O-methyltransferase [Clostridium sporogenes]MBD5639115.1 crotonobetainyl-CoA--carnitine CoA-transferase [Clostridium botulinum]